MVWERSFFRTHVRQPIAERSLLQQTRLVHQARRRAKARRAERHFGISPHKQGMWNWLKASRVSSCTGQSRISPLITQLLVGTDRFHCMCMARRPGSGTRFFVFPSELIFFLNEYVKVASDMQIHSTALISAGILTRSLRRHASRSSLTQLV